MRPRAAERVVNIPVTLCLHHATKQSSSVLAAQHLQPRRPANVLTCVNMMNPRREAMVNASSRRFVKVAPPTVHTGVGNALREAFAMDGQVRSLQMFEDLLAKLD